MPKRPASPDLALLATPVYTSTLAPEAPPPRKKQNIGTGSTGKHPHAAKLHLQFSSPPPRSPLAPYNSYGLFAHSLPSTMVDSSLQYKHIEMALKATSLIIGKKIKHIQTEKDLRDLLENDDSYFKALFEAYKALRLDFDNVDTQAFDQVDTQASEKEAHLSLKENYVNLLDSLNFYDSDSYDALIEAVQKETKTEATGLKVTR